MRNSSTKSQPRSEHLGVGLKPGDRHYRAYVGPPENYDILAALQFNLLTALGLREHHHLLDIGCGSLRAGRLFIPYLLPDRYCGLEPEQWLIQAGIEAETGQALIDLKRPRFAHNRDFDFSVFGRRFDYMLAQSVLTHAGRAEVGQFIRGVRESLGPSGIAAVTYHPGREDHAEDGWVYPGITSYTLDFLGGMIEDCGMEWLRLDWPHPGNIHPKWLAIGHHGLKSRIPAVLHLA